MQLKEYLEKNGIHPIVFAATTKISVSSIYAWMTKERVPHKKMAEKVEKFTHGQVTVEELRGKDK